MSGPMLDHVQIAAPPGCEPAARHFFGDLLGLEELPKPAPLSARGGCWFALGDRELHIGVDPDFAPPARPTWHCAWTPRTSTTWRPASPHRSRVGAGFSPSP
jgi:hypothetical protein